MAKNGYGKSNINSLHILSKQYTTIDEVSTEIINLQAILNLPKGTEHFLADIHGENEHFQHILKNASGVIKKEIENIFGNTISQAEKKELAIIIYYPEKRMNKPFINKKNIKDWYKIIIYRLIDVCRSFSSNYTRSKVRKAMPKSFNYILEELLYTQTNHIGNQEYYHEIVKSIIHIDRAKEFIIALSNLIQYLAIDQLHIIGDIYDRGPGAEFVMDTLINFHSIDIQWGNHDVLWIGAAAGSDVCIANVIRIAAQYATLNTLENGYGINLLPLATFALEYYKEDPCERFFPKSDYSNDYDNNEVRLISKMHKAIAIIQVKLENSIVLRNPDFEMNNRLLLGRIDFSNATILINNRPYKLLDPCFPTVDHQDPYKLTQEEKTLIQKLKLSFLNSEKLQRHIRFILSNGSIYLVNNSNILLHGCIPLDGDGGFHQVNFNKQKMAGKALLDFFDIRVRQAFFNREADKNKQNLDFIWYLWTGPHSPLFGKKKMTTFERYFLNEANTHVEDLDPYYTYRDDVRVMSKIIREFGVDPDISHIINGHVPVERKRGESPIKSTGKLIVIDGGFSKAYRPVTGIAGYTLISDSRGLSLISHKPFRSLEDTIMKGTDVMSSVEVFERLEKRMYVNDTDIGNNIKNQISILNTLLIAYRKGFVKERS